MTWGYHLDSLAFFELQAGLEKEFGVRLRQSDFSAPLKVGDMVRLVASRLESDAPA